VGVPYIDFGTVGVTADGSHVTTDTATRLTIDLVERLKGMDLKVVYPKNEDTDSGEAPALRQGGLSGYRFDQPVLELDLPDVLREISGLIAMGGNAIACIQDERGELHGFQTSDPDHITSTEFGPKGDYEALARAEERLFVLRSDGSLQALDLEGKARGKAVELGKGLPYTEYESLCFQPGSGRLLFAPKDAPEGKKGKLGKHDRPIYGMDLASMSVLPDPVLVFSVKDLVERAEAEGWPLPEKATKKGKRRVHFECRISDMAVHPQTGELYVLSGPDRTLVVLNTKGELQGTAVFPLAMLPQPEGLAFEASGALLLTSEGQKGAARLLKFDQRTGD
jgi:hypothetical protein